MKISNRTVDAYDYIANTQSLIRTLGIAVGAVVTRKHSALALTESVLRAARRDYRKQFPGENPPTWVTHRVSVEALLGYAKAQQEEEGAAAAADSFVTPYRTPLILSQSEIEAAREAMSQLWGTRVRSC